MQLFRHLPSLPVLDATGAIDIVVVAFLVYQCLMVVRGTRAGAILLGIAVIVCLYLAAVWADLEALHSVLSLIVPYIGLAVIVLFQSEIRRTLASLGRRRLLGLAGVFHAPEAANEILMAVEQLAAKKTGAPIVLERDIGLRTFIESGVRLEAQVSRDLLLSIFQQIGWRWNNLPQRRPARRSYSSGTLACARSSKAGCGWRRRSRAICC